ncbi:MAG: DUF255 domain-containing protein [Deltaproteobacteria bacterium]|nr:MAG: DUF255 domain-containing protein [Deltaproteobacteria bacterium]
MVMVGMGIFFLHGAWPALGEAMENIPLLWVAAAALAVAAAAGGFHLSWPDGTAAQKARKLLGIAAGGFAVLCLAAATFIGSAGKVGWHKDIEKGLAMARQQNRPAVVDFWATWCPACVELDRKTFSDPRVSRELQRRFVAIKIDCTSSAEDERLERLMEKYGAMDLPTIRFVDSKGRLLAAPVVKGFVPPERMLSILKSIE